jgi:hypothetical protein
MSTENAYFPKLYAHYFDHGIRGKVLYICTGFSTHEGVVKRIRVNGKKEAKLMAKKEGAILWNF